MKGALWRRVLLDETYLAPCRVSAPRLQSIPFRSLHCPLSGPLSTHHIVNLSPATKLLRKLSTRVTGPANSPALLLVYIRTPKTPTMDGNNKTNKKGRSRSKQLAWERHKELLKQLYLHDGQKLTEVMEVMRTAHNFEAR